MTIKVTIYGFVVVGGKDDIERYYFGNPQEREIMAQMMIAEDDSVMIYDFEYPEEVEVQEGKQCQI